MNQQERQRLRHAEQYRSGFQPSSSRLPRTWGFAPGCYRVALSALVCSFLLGCHSTPPVTTSNLPTQQAAAYPPRPSTPPPPVKLFHHTDTSLTLVTDPNATDEQVEALVWQLRDAAQTHTLATLGIDQAFVDKNKPSTWFHIYRGSKCAAEKYATGDPPCGGSYHAAADYTFGTVGNPAWDQGTLLHNEQETLLWNPDTPYKASSR